MPPRSFRARAHVRPSRARRVRGLINRRVAGQTHPRQAQARVLLGKRAQLTLDVGLQQHLTKLLHSYAVPYAAVVAIEPVSGRVLAYVSQSSDRAAGDLARDASPPSASVFKLVTASALLEAGVGPDSRACYSGGLRRLDAADLVDNPRRDRACATLGEAIRQSINSVVAKLADRHLDRER